MLTLKCESNLTNQKKDDLIAAAVDSNKVGFSSKTEFQSLKSIEINSDFESVRTEADRLKSILTQGAYLISDHCFNLRNQVQLATEKRIQQLNEQNEQLQNQINEYETKQLNQFHSNEVLDNKFNEFKNFIDKCCLRTEAVSEEKTRRIQNELHKIDSTLKSLIFNGEFLVFKQNDNLICLGKVEIR